MISITAYLCLPYWNLININELAMDRKWLNNSYILYDAFICNQISNIKSNKFYLKSKYL